MNLDRNKKYVVACSFGPDSMALLDMMIKGKYSLVVAHVNYHKRKESDFEQKSLEDYCKNHNVQLEVFDTKRKKAEGNFQDWARKIRYEFFKDVLFKYKAHAVVVAHQEDDLIETYLMQAAKKAFVSYFGIEKETVLFGVPVVRPLLDFAKKDLEKYDIDNNVPYSIDSSNLSNLYTRNKLRHEVVEKLSQEERLEIKKTIQKLNETKANLKEINLNQNVWELEEFFQQNPDILVLQISNNLQKRNFFKKITIKSILSIKKSFKSDHANIAQKIVKNIFLVKAYSKVYLVDFDQFSTYEYHIEKAGTFTSKFIDFDFSKDDVDRNISANDFPLTVKPVNKSELYQVADYNCEVRRLFIDWKMPNFLRGWWPGFYDKNGKLVYIPRYRETYSDKHTSKLIIKYPQF